MPPGGEVEIHTVITDAASKASNRFELWSSVVRSLGPATCAEIGVFRGEFAQHILRGCDAVERYYLLDPWRRLDHWNKPANRSDDEFREIRDEALARTAFAESRRIVLQGKTTEVSDELPDEGLDFAYIDGDHTLRGITIDLIRIWPKLRSGGILAGDDFCASAWQHELRFEPTLIYPQAVYFAEAVGAKIYGLPFDQFAIVVDRSAKGSFEFRDLTGAYASTALRDALALPAPSVRSAVARTLSKLKRLSTAPFRRR